MNIIVSACLMGVRCRYNGEGEWNEQVRSLMKVHHLIPVCPEIMGGLATPRDPAEIIDGRVMTCSGNDVTNEYKKGAEEILALARCFECTHAILKKRSPSCGKGRIYDGTFSGTLIDGDGITAGLLEAHGIHVFGEGDFKEEKRGKDNDRSNKDCN